ncbi:MULTISPECIES: DUF4340 domain-containing protein [unclassified Ruminococcus]|uniref:DUF4340 domain-containing protein n=1 Tax=unclassified Ruminococcus TaxID=2608920 RepID=UPI00189DF786|nr:MULTISPECIES: DUF4340 domain-containing protein [unclassified Ruminococcus]MDB8756417.1 DUF4340 domain-containing protein [Ruminococcus sp. 1001136sp1]MDB8760515.1 DUF4340 domain-containing protein [Ruminococcus sp. 1001136sp1]MDB8764524.1 DUF4340 domain-containing protein [Ruminococcus sp. 1001136sp1]MDB8768369.1 DUF4340 domain-containing protein [Ruminococcus sp. 1001136sp1]
MKKKSVNLITAVGVLVVLSGAYVGVKAYVAKQEAADAESAEKENPEIISIASADVKSIKFVIDKKEVTFEKNGDSWVKSDETDFPVDQDKIDTLVNSMNSIKAERTLENVEDASEYELDQPENTITVTTEDGETTVIQLGMENDSTSQEYIDLNEDSSTVYVVSNSTFSSFKGTLYDFAKSGVFPTVDSSTVSKISVDGKDSSYVVEKDENNFWNITGDGETEKADSAKATSLASALSSMAYSSYVNYNCAEDEFSQYGLDKPYAEIIVDYQKEVEKESTDDENEAENGDEEVSEASENENQGDETADSETDGSESLDEDVDSETDGNESSDEDVDSETDGSESSDENVDVADTEDSEVVENENTDETADDNVEAEDTDVTEADDAAEVEAADTESTESSGESETETEMVDRELVIQVGDQSSDGGRYVRVNDSNEIYTISEDSLDTFLGKTNADFWDLTVSYLSVNNLDTLDVNYGGEDYIVNVSRETSEDENVETSDDETENEDTTDSTSSDVVDGNDVEGNAADDNTSSGDLTDEDTENTDDSSSTASTTSSTGVTLSYTLNGKDLDSTTFTTFYNKLINMTAQKRLTDEFKSNEDPEMTVKFTDIDGNEMEVEYYSYDTNYYAAVINKKVYLVNKMTVKELFQAFESVTGEKEENENAETTDPETNASTDNAETETTEASEDAEE